MGTVTDVEEAHASLSVHHRHDFSVRETADFRANLISWFIGNARELPWRSQEKDDRNKRAYGVWVSEVMLQQTRVSVVIDFWNRWMKRWPTVEALSKASVEEVHEAWAGLGYYQRATRLLEGAKVVMTKLGGKIPQTAVALQEIPGIGPYTASAIASIAFDEPVGVVDGNVLRVMSRHRGVLASPKHAPFVKYCWSLVSSLVDPQRPGPFNEALMELGATICTPQNPQCGQCPVRADCIGRMRCESPPALSLPDDDDDGDAAAAPPPPACSLCDATLPFPSSVCDLPLKAVKPTARPIWTLSLLIERQNEAGESSFLMQQRPATGLLANLWEFPGITHDPPPQQPSLTDASAHTDSLSALLASLALPYTTIMHIGDTSHQFSHISQRISAFLVTTTGPSSSTSSDTEAERCKWFLRSDLEKAAVSKGVHKCVALLDGYRNAGSETKKTKRKESKHKTEREGDEGGTADTTKKRQRKTKGEGSKEETKPKTKREQSSASSTTGKAERDKKQRSLDSLLPALATGAAHIAPPKADIIVID